MRRDSATVFQRDPARSIESFIKRMVRDSLENRLFLIDDTRIFGPPLVGFADGDDPLFSEFKSIIGPFHLTPREVLQKTLDLFSETPSRHKIKDVSVICWALPITERTRRSNAREERVPSKRWCHTRHYGELFNESLRRRVEALLADHGSIGVAPMLSPVWSYCDDARGPASNWSERHALYVAGMGTFGLSDGFITPKGVAMRCGSVVTDLKLPPSPRKYPSRTANCPFFTDGSCRACISRCPAGAITVDGHDKKKCEKYYETVIRPLETQYEVDDAGCGLCQTGVPCESGIPGR